MRERIKDLGRLQHMLEHIDLGIPYPIAKLCAHLNNFFFDPDSKWHLDSKDDQFSIKLGYQWRQGQ